LSGSRLEFRLANLPIYTPLAPARSQQRTMQLPGSSRSACAASTSPFDYATRLQEGLAQIFDFLKSHRTRGPTTGDRPFFLEIDLECAVDRFADDRELAALNRRRCTSRQTTGIRMTRPAAVIPPGDRWSQVRNRLAAGGKRIRTIGPA
jgi:hypothetical protein